VSLDWVTGWHVCEVLHITHLHLNIIQELNVLFPLLFSLPKLRGSYVVFILESWEVAWEPNHTTPLTFQRGKYWNIDVTARCSSRVCGMVCPWLGSDVLKSCLPLWTRCTYFNVAIVLVSPPVESGHVLMFYARHALMIGWSFKSFHSIWSNGYVEVLPQKYARPKLVDWNCFFKKVWNIIIRRVLEKH
jgi:hypothetical protein